MRIVIALSTAALAAALSSPAPAQQSDASVGSYLCQFAGKCGPAPADTPADATPTPAPAPAMRTSETRGFRLPGAAPLMTMPKSLPATPARRTDMASRRAAPAAGTGSRVNLQLTFEYNSDAMTPAAKAKARVFAQALMTPELKSKRFLIEGHTDARGSRELNVDLSRRRAQSVADFLIAQGVDPRSVDVKGVGPDAPLPGQAATAEANRRVEAVLIS